MKSFTFSPHFQSKTKQNELVLPDSFKLHFEFGFSPQEEWIQSYLVVVVPHWAVARGLFHYHKTTWQVRVSTQKLPHKNGKPSPNYVILTEPFFLVWQQDANIFHSVKTKQKAKYTKKTRNSMWWRLNNDVAMKKKHLQSKYSLKRAALVLSTNHR